MPRPRKLRNVAFRPPAAFYKPQGIPMRELRSVQLSVDGLEAMRLADALGLSHDEAAVNMNVSRPTFSRLLSEAHRVVAEALINGWALRIDGGDYLYNPDADVGGDIDCPGRRRRGPCRKMRQAQEEVGDTIDATATEPHQTTDWSKAMKLAISAVGPSGTDSVDARFGRAAGFALVDADGAISYLPNPALNAAEGAAIAVVEMLAAAGVDTVLTGALGPKAIKALAAARISGIEGYANLTVDEAITRYRSGKSAADGKGQAG